MVTQYGNQQPGVVTDVTSTQEVYKWPIDAGDHRLYIEEGAEDEEMLFAYCAKCSHGDGPPVNKFRKLTPKEQRKLRQYYVGYFLSRPCDKAVSNEIIDITISGDDINSPSVLIEADIDTRIRESIKDTVIDRKAGQIATPDNLKW